MTARLRKLAIPLVGFLLLWAGSATASDPAAAGSAAAHTQDQVQTLASELRATAERHGPDSVALQASFLVETLRAGAVAASEVGVVGPSDPPHEEYLRIRVLTGILFDPTVTTPQSRFAALWGKVVAPTIGKMNGFAIEPAGLEVHLGFGLQAFGEYADRKPDVGGDMEMVGRIVRIDQATLAALAAHELTVDDVRERAEVIDESSW